MYQADAVPEWTQSSASRLRGAVGEADEYRVVRIRLGLKLYAYRCAGRPHFGRRVQAVTPFSGTVKRRVLAFGRGRYTGPLKRCTLVHR